ncbi:DUF222 domain-containing protein [Schumannella luteola]
MNTLSLPALHAFSRADAAALSDERLLEEQRAFAAARRLVDAGAAAVAAEIAARSDRSLGVAGLAQGRGARTPEALVAQLTGVSVRDARTLVTAGELVSTPAPGLEPLAAAVTSGDLSVEAALAVKAGLGDSDRVDPDARAGAAERLVREASGLTLEQLAARAREAGAALDVADVPRREEQLRERRFLTLTPLPDGMTRLSGLLDPESAAVIRTAVDAATAPQRGGPRFVDRTAAPEPHADDTRTVPQLLLDALVDLITVATHADTGRVLGSKRVGVRVHVSQRDLSTGTGFASIEGQTAPISIATAQRISCDAGLIPVLFDTDGRILNVGRTQRHHTARMRVGLAARDGGCTIPGCARPPDWCEAHHIDEWQRHGGDTSTDDGVLLCRHHHQLLHAKCWRIVRIGSQYWLDRGNGDRVPLQHRNPTATRVHPPPRQ